MTTSSTRERERNADRSRELILDAAEKLFADRGYEATSLQDVGTEAGVSRGLQPMQHSKEMDRQDEETAIERVRNAEFPVESGKPRLRHNRAIEFGGVGRVPAPRFPGTERVQRTVRFV